MPMSSRTFRQHLVYHKASPLRYSDREHNSTFSNNSVTLSSGYGQFSEMAVSTPLALTRPPSLLSFPKEVLQKIYEYVLTVNVEDSKPYVVVKHRSCETCSSRALECTSTSHSCLELLRCCRQILFDAFHIFYRNNTLQFSSAYEMSQFCYVISTAKRNEITSVRCAFDLADRSSDQVRWYLQRCFRLEKLQFEVFARPHGRVFRTFRGLKEVEMNVEPDPYGRPRDQELKIAYWKELLTRPRLPVPTPECLDLFAVMKRKKVAKPKEPLSAPRLADYW